MGSGMDRRAFSSTNCRAGVIIMISRVETFRFRFRRLYRVDGVGSRHGTQVVEGMEVVKEIEGVPTDGRDKPIDAVRVETITIEE